MGTQRRMIAHGLGGLLLVAALVAELKKPEIRQFLDGLGIIPIGSGPESFAAKLKEMTAHWAEFATKLGLEKQ